MVSLYFQFSVFVDRSFSSVPSDVPQNFTVQIISPTTILLSWLPPPPESRNGQILGFTVTITQDGDGPTMTIPVENNEHEVLVNNLLQFTTYTCSILAFTAIGNGPTSQTVTLTTLEDGRWFYCISINCLVLFIHCSTKWRSELSNGCGLNFYQCIP